jgi:DNA repair exonuclease SbcCD ATPase subunit
MIARLEEANTKAHEQLARADEPPAGSGEAGVADHQSSHHVHVVAPERRSAPTRLLLFALFGLLIAASAYLAAFAGQPYYGSVIRPFIARWAIAWTPQTESRTETMPREDAVASSTLSMLEQRLQRMTDDLQQVERRLEQLKASQDQISRSQADVAEQFKASHEQTTRDNAKLAEQLDGALAQLARQNAGLAEQLKANRDQLAEIASSRTATSSHRPSRRKPISIVPSIVPSPQQRAQAQGPSRQP